MYIKDYSNAATKKALITKKDYKEYKDKLPNYPKNKG